MLWSSKTHNIGDLHIVRAGNEYHLFTEQLRREIPDSQFAGNRVVGHYVSKDMFDWEPLPDSIACGKAGEFDAYTIYHMGVYVHEGMWYMHYTGLDKPGAGQQQAVGLATSKDGIKWTKHPNNPVLRADTRWYEPAIPPEATYQKKDGGRLWFRDPFVIRNAKTGEFGMIVIARDKEKHPDVRGCLAWATSKDMINWQAQPPIFSPGRFHTIETPSIYEHNGRHYVVYMTHPAWGAPIMTSDPYKTAGDFYAASESGWTGPYHTPEDEVLVASHGQMRMGAAKIIQGPNGEHFLYGWLMLTPEGEDIDTESIQLKVVPPPRRVTFREDGQIHVTYYEKIESFTRPVPIKNEISSRDPDRWKTTATVVGKHLGNRTLACLPGEYDNFIFSVRVRFLRGERAGIAFRADETGVSGLYAVADQRYGRIEFGTLDKDRFSDARVWKPKDELELKVIAYGPSIEVYADDRLVIRQARHREVSGGVGYIVERGEGEFEKPRLLQFG